MLYTTGVTVYAVLHLVYAAAQFLRGYQKFSAYRISAGARHVGLTLAVASLLLFPAPETARAAEVASAVKRWIGGHNQQYIRTTFSVESRVDGQLSKLHELRPQVHTADYYGPPLTYHQEYQWGTVPDVPFDKGLQLRLLAAPRSGGDAKPVGEYTIRAGDVLHGEKYIYELCLVVEPTGSEPEDWRLSAKQDCSAEGPTRRRTRVVHEHDARIVVIVRHRDEPQLVLYRSNGHSGSLVSTDPVHVRALRTVVHGATNTLTAVTFWVGLGLAIVTVFYDVKLDRTAERIAKDGRRTGSLEASCWQDGLVQEAATRSPKKLSPTRPSFALPS